MPAVTVDAVRLRIAIPAIEQLTGILDWGTHALAGSHPPAGVPAGLQARFAHVIAAGRRDLKAASHRLDAVPGDLLRRISAAQVADSPVVTAGNWGNLAWDAFMDAFKAAHPSGSAEAGWLALKTLAGARNSGLGEAYQNATRALANVHRLPELPKSVADKVKWGGRLSSAANVAIAGYDNLRNPYLSNTQRATRTAAAVGTSIAATEAGGALGGALAAATVGSAAGPFGFAVGFGAGIAWTAFDGKFHISNKIGDAAASAADGIAHGAKDAVHGAKKLFHKFGL